MKFTKALLAAGMAAAALAGSGWSGGVARAQAPGPDGEFLTPEVAEVTVDEHLGEFLDPELTFKDQEGQVHRLGDYFDKKTPMLVTLNYYKCPGICNVQLGAVTKTLQNMEWTAGDGNFRVLTFSIDPTEKPALAKEKRANILKELARGEDVDWSFMTGSALSIRSLAAQFGVGYAYDKDKDQYAHPPVIMFVSPEGKIARYVYGLSYAPADVKFALMEASEGRVGTTVDRLILSCFHYDASAGKYGPQAFGIMRLAAALMVLLVGLFLLFAWRREKRRRSLLSGGA